MISPHTPPGTKIICVDDSLSDKYVAPHALSRPAVGDLDGLRNGDVYTVAEIIKDPDAKGGFVVRLEEIMRSCALQGEPDGFALHRFRYLDLPKCLTDLLNVVSEPVLENAT
jgi:hypothetical protein